MKNKMMIRKIKNKKKKNIIQKYKKHQKIKDMIPNYVIQDII